MNADLEKTVEELGSDYGDVLVRLRNAREIEAGRKPADLRKGPLSIVFCPLFHLTAAVLVLGFVLAVIIFQSAQSESAVGPAPHEYAMTVAEMIASQKPDGSWQNAFLTRRNAEALRFRTDPASRIAYKKAMRNLRLRGLL